MVLPIVLADMIVGLGSMAFPAIVDFAKKKWLPGSADTPERTMSALATTKPEVLPAYVSAIAANLKAKVAYFNRDVTGTPSQWVIDFRAAIRPSGVAASLGILAAMAAGTLVGAFVYPESLAKLKDVPEVWAALTGVRLSCVSIVGSWFGSRLTIGGNN